MPSKSKSQQKLFAQAWAIRQGKLDPKDAWPVAARIAKSDMDDKDIEDFAATKTKDLPYHVNDSLSFMTFEQFTKKAND